MAARAARVRPWIHAAICARVVAAAEVLDEDIDEVVVGEVRSEERCELVAELASHVEGLDRGNVAQSVDRIVPLQVPVLVEGTGEDGPQEVELHVRSGTP